MVNMTTQELKDCKWEKADKIQTSQILNACKKYGMKGVLDELTSICQGISIVIGLPFNEVFEIFKSQNSLFYYNLQRFQHQLMVYGEADLSPSLAYLFLPDISQEKNAIECLSLFFSLTSEEKDIVLKGMQTYTNSLN